MTSPSTKAKAEAAKVLWRMLPSLGQMAVLAITLGG